MFVPHHMNPLSREKIILYTPSGIGYHWCLHQQQKTPFPGYSRGIFPRQAPKNACIRVGGPGLPLTVPLLGCLCDPP